MNSVYEKVKAFKLKYSNTIAWRLKSHCKIIDMHINPDEEVLYAFACQKNTFSYEIFTTYVIVLTNKRLLVAQKRLFFGYFLISVTPDLYNDMTIKMGLLWGKVIIDTVKEKIELSNIDKDALPEIETQISQFMMEAKKEY
ncbi:MAG: PH domain-containing protein [Bacilli bacterium]